MKIVIFHPYVETRVHDISYENLYHACGYSGTETAMMEFAKYLTDVGHELHILGPVRNRSSTYQGKIQMYPCTEESIHEIQLHDADVFCPIYFVQESVPLLQRLDPMKTMLWLMVQWFIDEALILQLMHVFRVKIQCVSPFVDMHYPRIHATHKAVITNGIHPDFCSDIQRPEVKKGNWIFFASYERGGPVAVQVFQYAKKLLPDVATKMHLCSYYTPQQGDLQRIAQKDSSIEMHGSVAKSELLRLLDESDYFVYPLVLENGIVHHDTFGCVILEAMARGVIVVTWDVACNRTLYGDNILQLPVLPEEGYDPLAKYGRNSRLASQEAVQRLTQAILNLESDPERKEALRERAKQWAHGRLWSEEAKKLEVFLKT